MFVWLNQTVLSFLEHLLYTYYTPCFKEGGLVATKEAIVKDQVCSTVFNSIVDRHFKSTVKRKGKEIHETQAQFLKLLVLYLKKHKIPLSHCCRSFSTLPLSLY